MFVASPRSSGPWAFTALVGANPFLLMVTIVGLAKCFHEARHGAGLKRVASGGGRGMVGTTALLGASRLMPAAAWVTLMLGVGSYLVAAKRYDKAEPKAEEVARIVRDWFGAREWTDSCSHLARDTYLRGKAVVGNVADSELAQDVANTVSAWSRASAGAIEGALVDWIPEHGPDCMRGGAAVEACWTLIGSTVYFRIGNDSPNTATKANAI